SKHKHSQTAHFGEPLLERLSRKSPGIRRPECILETGGASQSCHSWANKGH
ncbi:hypothetical protein BCR33DRAFT_713102, partial [Rhizoclosmatium globosum]